MAHGVRVVLFAEGSASIGAGHQVRCAALAQALLARGHEPILAARALPGSAQGWAWEGLPFEVLPDSEGPAASALEAVTRLRPAVVVADHYELQEEQLAALSQAAPVALLDDVPGARASQVALVVNAAPGVMPAEYPHASVALGAAHALVRPEFASLRQREPEPRVFVALGSAASLDRGAILDSVLEAAELPVDWLGALPSSVAASSRVRHLPRQSALALAEHMARSQVGILSASSICFEAACCGLPFVAVRTAAHQERLGRGLTSLDIPLVSTAEASDCATLRAALARAVRGRLSVDGRGPGRVAARVVELAVRTRPVSLRPAVWTDAAALLAWANDPQTREGSFETHAIGPEEHHAWLAAKLLDPEARLFVAIDEATAGGTARLDRAAGVAAVSLAVAPDRRRRGMAGRILEALREWSRSTGFAERLEALVRDDNLVSLRLFERAGYARTGRLSVKGVAAIRFERQV